jgi:hypothetical protein
VAVASRAERHHASLRSRRQRHLPMR